MVGRLMFVTSCKGEDRVRIPAGVPILPWCNGSTLKPDVYFLSTSLDIAGRLRVVYQTYDQRRKATILVIYPLGFLASGRRMLVNSTLGRGFESHPNLRKGTG